MAHGYNTKLPNLNRYPGDGYYYIICDVCGIKIRRKDAVYITDRYNTQNKLLVCKKDADVAQPQLRPYKARERKSPKITRSEPSDNYSINPNSSIAPSAPVQVRAFLDPLNNYVDLTWLGPDDPGTDQITGYVITRATPQLSTQVIINANTGNSATFYQDLSSDYTIKYTYTVAAINAYGTGPYSAVAFYPSQLFNITPPVPDGLLLTGSNSKLTTGTGQYLIVGVGP